MDDKTHDQNNDHNQNAESTADAQCPRCEEYLAGWKRAQADYANLKRDVEREKAEFSKYANERLLSDLLPAIDQYDIALAFIPELGSLSPEDRKRFDNWMVGIKAVRSIWENAFREIGLEQVPTTGQFDPLLHEAVGEEESDKPEHEIVRVMQIGWRLNGKLLRPAKVILSKHTS